MTTTNTNRLKKDELVALVSTLRSQSDEQRRLLIAVGVICFVLGAISW